MCQYHSSSQLKRRSLLRVGPKIERKVIFIGDPNIKGEQLLLHTNHSFPQYWKLPCNEYTVVDIHPQSKLAVDLRASLCQSANFQLISLKCIQSPQKWASFMHKKGKIIQKYSDGSYYNERDKQYLEKFPLNATLLDSHILEYYMWGGNTHQVIENITSKTHEIGLAMRTAILSGFGGFYFCEKSVTADQYCTCSNCNGGGYGVNSKKCNCIYEDQIFTMMMCRVILGKVQCDFDFSHEKFSKLTKAPASYNGGLPPDSILGVNTYEDCSREVIISDSSQFYPEFLITYKRPHPSGKQFEMDIPKVSTNELAIKINHPKEKDQDMVLVDLDSTPRNTLIDSGKRKKKEKKKGKKSDDETSTLLGTSYL